MDTQLLQEVLECLRGERTLYYHQRDQYALYLLSRLAKKYARLDIRMLKSSPWKGLLNRPAVANVVANCGDGVIRSEDLNNFWLEEPEPFVLTLGQWGTERNWNWSQTSRPGGNLVLQLNLSSKWSRRFERLVKMSANDFLACGHPLSDRRPATLAWARLDVDFRTDELLIEEIQSDLVRDVTAMAKLAKIAHKVGKSTFHFYGSELATAQTIMLQKDFSRAFNTGWKEAMLSAAIMFALDELGIRQVYYHSFETGNAMKNIKWRKPPRSLYTDLPKRFCFQPVSCAPNFLQQEKALRRKLKKLKNPEWFLLAA